MPGMLRRHMFWLGSHAGIVLPDRRGDAFTLKIDLNQLVTGMKLNLLAYTVMWHRIQVLIIANVLIDINASCFNVRVLISVFR